MPLDYDGVDPIRAEDGTLDGGTVREALANDRSNLRITQAYGTLYQALQFIQGESKTNSFYAGRSLEQSITERIEEIGVDLPPANPGDSAPSFLSDEAYVDGELTAIGQLERLRYEVKQAIETLRQHAAESVDRRIDRD